MAPKHSLIVPPVQATRQSSRATRKPITELIVESTKKGESQTSRRRRDEGNEIIVKKGPDQQSEDLYDGPPQQMIDLPDEEDADKPTGNAESHSHSKVCANNFGLHFIYLMM
jgi:hypothetical protein